MSSACRDVTLGVSLRSSHIFGRGGLVVTLFLIVWSSAQLSTAQQVENPKYWIMLADKADDPGKTVATAEHVTDTALQRRRRRGGPAVSSRYDGNLSRRYVRRLQELGVEPVVESRWLNAVSAHLSDSDVDVVRRLPFVRELRMVGSRVEENVDVQSLLMSSLSQPSPMSSMSNPPPGSLGLDPQLDYGASETQLALMNAIPNLENSINGEGVILGFLDTTYDGLRHPVFASLKADGRLLGIQDFTQGGQLNTHGMSTASVAFGFSPGNLIGPAHGASVLLATTEYAPTETNQEEDNFVAGLEWLESQGVDVVNVSLGYTTFDPGQDSYTTDDMDGDTGITTVVSDIAASLGVIVVTSAGNSGTSSWRIIGNPADGDSVIAVGAVDAAGVKASFSSVGPTADGRIKPDVSAMGVFAVVASGTSTFAFSNGTSFASPLVAGVVCQMLQVNPNLDPIDVRNILRSTASQATTPDNELGWGIVDAQAAVLVAQNTNVGLEQIAETSLTIDGPYPNPARVMVKLVLTSSSPVTVSSSLFDILGRRVQTYTETEVVGSTTLTFSTETLTSGTYFVRLVDSRGRTQTKKLAVVD